VTAYRNDIDALEARHAALEAEVADRTRERDEAARMLDEARGRAAVELREREAPLRRQRAIAIMIFLAVGSIMTYGLYKRFHHESDGQKVLRKLEQYENKMCACANRACAEQINQELTNWITDYSKNADEKPDPELAKKAADIVTHYSECMTKLMTYEGQNGAY